MEPRRGVQAVSSISHKNSPSLPSPVFVKFSSQRYPFLFKTVQRGKDHENPGKELETKINFRRGNKLSHVYSNTSALSPKWNPLYSKAGCICFKSAHCPPISVLQSKKQNPIYHQCHFQTTPVLSFLLDLRDTHYTGKTSLWAKVPGWGCWVYLAGFER